MQTLQTYEQALKDCYRPAWRNQLGIDPSPLLGKIKQIPLVGHKIVTSAPIGLSGGFGFASEGGATPKSGNVEVERFEATSKDMYVDICISNKVVNLGSSDKNAMLSALDTEMKGAYETAKWNTGRALFGNGEGVLAKLTDTTTGAEADVESVKNLKEGLIVDFYTSAGSKVGTGRIKSISRNGYGGGSITLYEALPNETMIPPKKL